MRGVPSDFRLVLGEGGASTGRWSGYTVEQDGDVLAWRGPTAEAAPRQIATLSDEELARFWQEAVELDLFDAEMQANGSRTAFIRIRANGREHLVSWVPGYPPLEPPKTPVEAYYRAPRRPDA